MRYIRAFFAALLLTLQGKKIEAPTSPYPNLQAWVKRGLELTNTAYQTAEASGLDEAARKAFTLRLDGRNWSMDLVLASARFHFSTEYPALIKTIIEHNLTTVYALNFDDQYRVSQLAQAENLPPNLKMALQALAEHLQNIPSSKNP